MTTDRDMKVIIPVVIFMIAALLLIYLRSIVAMIYLIITVLLSYFSALGAGWLLIHYGLDMPAISGLIPLYSFVLLVALGEDYNIFMHFRAYGKIGNLSRTDKRLQMVSVKQAVS